MQNFWELVKTVWTEGIFGVQVNELVIALAILVFFFLLKNIFARFVVRWISRFTASTETTVDDAILEALEGPIRFVPAVIGFFFATSYLTLDENMRAFVILFNRSLVAFALFWGLYQLSDLIGHLLQRAEQLLSRSMIDWLSKAVKLAFIILGFATILEIWGIQVAPLLAGLGLFGVAVALGAQDLFKNLIAGIFILGERRFHPGDWILVPGIVEGTVEHIGFRTTTVRQFDKAPVYLPNAQLSDNATVNFSRMTYRRIKWVIGLEYNSTSTQLKAVRERIETYLMNNEDFVQPKDTTTFVHIDSFSASSIDILMYAFTKTTDWLAWLKVKEQLLLEIKTIVEEEGASFAFPSQSLYIEAMASDVDVAPIQAKG